MFQGLSPCLLQYLFQLSVAQQQRFSQELRGSNVYLFRKACNSDLEIRRGNNFLTEANEKFFKPRGLFSSYITITCYFLNISSWRRSTMAQAISLRTGKFLINSQPSHINPVHA